MGSVGTARILTLILLLISSKALITALSIWNLAEVQIGIVAACGPTLRQPLARLMPSVDVVASLLSKLGLRRQSEKIKSSQLPSFVQAPQQDSAQYLQDISRVALVATQKTQSKYSHFEGHSIPSRTVHIEGNVHHTRWYGGAVGRH